MYKIINIVIGAETVVLQNSLHKKLNYDDSMGLGVYGFQTSPYTLKYTPRLIIAV